VEGRYHKVILDNNVPNSSSYWGEIRLGVPQGNTLALLFLLYVNDLAEVANDKAELGL
jgi:hypothetical protein